MPCGKPLLRPLPEMRAATSGFEPAYLRLLRSGELEQRVKLAWRLKVLAFLAREISPDTYLNLMDQYHPCYRADESPPLDRPISAEEYRHALELAERYGLRRLDKPRSLRWL